MINKENLEQSVRYEGFYRKGESQHLGCAVWDGEHFQELLCPIRPSGAPPVNIAYWHEDPVVYFEPQCVFVGDPKKRGYV